MTIFAVLPFDSMVYATEVPVIPDPMMTISALSGKGSSSVEIADAGTVQSGSVGFGMGMPGGASIRLFRRSYVSFSCAAAAA